MILIPKITSDVLIQELVPDVHCKKQYVRSSEPMFFKTHFLPSPEYRRVINIVRDGRDVVCSFRHFAEALGNQVNIDQLIDNGAIMGFGTWQDHIASYSSNPYDADILLVRYEDLIDDCPASLARIADFIGVTVGADRIKRLSEGTVAEKMKKREATYGWASPIWPRDKLFIRKGIKRAYQQEMSADQIKRFTMMSYEALSLLGYSAKL